MSGHTPCGVFGFGGIDSPESDGGCGLGSVGQINDDSVTINNAGDGESAIVIFLEISVWFAGPVAAEVDQYGKQAQQEGQQDRLSEPG